MKIIRKISLLVAISIMALLLASCGSQSSLKNNISELRKNYFHSENESYYVSLTTGTRENPYISDGKYEGNLTEFGLIEVKLFDKLFSGETISYKMTIDNIIIEGVLEKNPFTSTFMDDIERDVDDISKVYLVLDYGEKEELCLQNKSINFTIDYKEAIDIASSAMSEKFKEKDIDFNGETYLKLIHDNSSHNTFFWLFTAKNRDLKTYSIIIDVENGQIVVFSI